MANTNLDIDSKIFVSQSQDYSEINAIGGSLIINGTSSQTTTVNIDAINTNNQTQLVAVAATDYSKVNINTVNANSKGNMLSFIANNGELNIGKINVSGGAHFSVDCGDNSLTTIGKLDFTALSDSNVLSTIYMASETATLVFGGSYVNPENNVRFDLAEGTLVLTGTMQCNEIYVDRAIKMVFSDEVFDAWGLNGTLDTMLICDAEVYLDDSLQALQDVINAGLDEYANSGGKYDVSGAYVEVIDGKVYLQNMAIPEPSSLLLAGLATTMAICTRRRKSALA